MSLTVDEERTLCAAVQRGDAVAERSVLAAFAGLVKKLARQHARLPVFDVGDAESEAEMGVLAAARSFDAGRGLRLSTLVHTCIQRRLWRATRDQGLPVRIPAYVISSLRRLEAAERVLEVRLKRPPGDEEIAAEVQMTVKAIQTLRGYPRIALSLDATPDCNSGAADPDPFVDFLASPDPTPLEVALRQVDLDVLDQALRQLGPAEEEIIRRRFGLAPHDQPASQREIGLAMRISTQSVCNKEHKALRRLRTILSEYNQGDVSGHGGER